MYKLYYMIPILYLSCTFFQTSTAEAIITATASVLGSCLCPPLLEALKLQWRLKSAMATMLMLHLGDKRYCLW